VTALEAFPHGFAAQGAFVAVPTDLDALNQGPIDGVAVRAIVRAWNRCGTGKGTTMSIRRLISIIAFPWFLVSPIVAQTLAVASENTR
jgi:hypothetical protein